MGILGRRFAAPLALTALALLASVTPVASQHPNPIPWQRGPVLAQLGDLAEIQVPEGYEFTGKEGTRKLLELSQNLVSGRELGALVPNDTSATWFAIFTFNDIGFVKDDEKDKIDATALLESLRKGTEHANEERKKRGWETLTIMGWERTPYYDSTSHNLTWAIRGQSSTGTLSVNHSVRILGRRGTMDVDLVLSPDQYATATPQFESVLSGFRFKQGHQYADFVKGDKIAAFGLSALVLGGVGAVAMKTGFLAASWKLLLGLALALKKAFILLILAIWAGVKRFFGRVRGAVAPKDEVAGAPPEGGGTGSP